jgi:ElaB/YqjD/DUF883 family membrane-anchored ribosome-binding protein
MATDETKDELGALRDDIAKVKADILTLAEDLRRLGLAAAGTARRSAEAEGERLRTDVDEVIAELRRQGERTLQDAKASVEERPLLAVLIALAVGFVLGRILDRR